jgi:hypothetical protein
MRVAMATEAAGVRNPNEDFTGAVPRAAVVVDGAGISGAESICRHGAAWHAYRLGGELLALLALEPGRSLRAVLSAAIERVAGAHRGTCDLADPSSPSAAVAVLRLSPGRADYLLLGDAVLVLDKASGPLVVTDLREVTLSRPYRDALSTAAPDTTEYEHVRSAFIDMLRANRNQPGGFWVAKEDPRAADEAVTGSCAVSELRSAVLLSNGASRIVDRFHLADWPDVLTLLNSGGPATVIRRVREEENRRQVAADDATITHCVELDEDPTQ